MKYPKSLGLDEAGLGELAGPLVVCVFTCPDAYLSTLKKLGCKDSKKTSNAERIRISKQLKKDNETGLVNFSIVLRSVAFIDLHGCWYAWQEASTQALEALWHGELDAGVVVIDGKETLQKSIPGLIQIAEPCADETNIRVAAASILARNYLDDYWRSLKDTYPDWEFQYHHGNASKWHIHMLKLCGPLEGIHRKFPVETLLKTLAKGGGPDGHKTQP